ncbi:excinuclease ABC subunit UvrA [uncultured Phascolarctobacterium sp.]|uniref:excinuclease ABC subunit UvrA n=1 Tax=uncultured Phascolarctobacterium sp. TaxID=512296 RepID=UPI00262451F2|nr:excinuclease ABC subunit UvrA [uncultured Phascolarctobacterium sp.]
MQEFLIVKGARQHNLKNITVEIPRNKMVVITGLSGSGKSSLAFDTIYAEGQRRYVESLSAYARQFLGQMDKPDVDYIEGLSPAISIDQKTTSRNPRSTVGTVTEIYDYLRLLFARAGEPHCPKCSKLIEQQSVQQIVDKVLELPQGSRFMVMAPLVRGRKGEHMRLLDDMRRAGYVRMYIDGEVRTLDEDIRLEKNKKHSLSVVIDRLAVREGIRQRLTDSVETALKLADGFAEVATLGETTATQLFSEHFACNDCGISLPAIEPRLFSFNNPFGACPDCTGLGMHMEFDKALIVPDADKSFAERCIACFSNNLNSYFMKQLGAVLAAYGYSYDTKWNELTPEMQQLLWDGAGESKFKFLYENLQGEVKEHNTTFDGILNVLRRRYREAFSDAMRQDLEEFMTSTPCAACHGSRLKPEALAILIGGKNICEVTALTVRDCLQFFKKLELTPKQQIIAHQVLKEIMARLQFLNDVGLDYLTLDRSAGTLSGGEAQRIRLATQIGSGLTGVLYILDEPSIGLHQRDNGKLLETLKHLRDLGNTLIVVEHDEETMYAADQIIDIGPGAGEHGGEVVAQGTVEEIKQVPASVTGTYLSGRKFIPVPKHRRECDGRMLTIHGARANNLKNIDVSIPLGVFTVVTGVSGSGKSTLINDILYNSLAAKLNSARLRASEHDSIEGIEYTDKVINIDQSPIGRTPRSNPATYTGVFDFIRELFSQTNEAKLRGYKAGRFSFNVKGGRCEACKGDGMNKIEMNFLPDVYVPCEVCHGARYNRDTLEVHYKGKSIAEVLDMTVSEACEFFKNQPRIYRKLAVLEDVGLGYIHLGQAATTLSGGEAQRVKLATELSRRSTGRTVYILDEPTTGLHIADVHKLLDVLQRLVEGGDSVIVIEHNLDVIKVADYIIDLGPEGGDKGGTLVDSGTPEEVAKVKKSYTGQYIKQELAKAKKNGWYV